MVKTVYVNKIQRYLKDGEMKEKEMELLIEKSGERTKKGTTKKSRRTIGES